MPPYAGENIVACLDCDLLQRIPPHPPGTKVRCRRCGHTIAVSKPNSLERTMALAIAAAVMLIVANVYPLMELSVSGRQASTTIIGGAWEMWKRDQHITAFIVMFCTVFAPAVHIAMMIVILFFSRQIPAPRWISSLLRWSQWHQPWSMVEVMLLGILVALIKIADVAMVSPGIGIFAAGALVALVTAMTASFDPGEVWRRVEWVSGEMPQGYEQSAGHTKGYS